ncbi:MAG: hypothetical protein P8P89_09750, partial [Paracoccaceae bacterium]|nr:hypothetical protein [Paracoccaceae bacterium]
QGKKTKEQGSLNSPRKHDFSIDKINRREVHLHQLQSLMKSAANGGLEPTPEVLKSCCARTQHENPLRRREIAAVSQRRLRSFKYHAANLKPRIHGTLVETAFYHTCTMFDDTTGGIELLPLG